jgi:hypothetical protein
VLRRIFWPKRNKVTGGWRNLHKEEFRNLYTSPNTIRILKSRRMGWEGQMARTRKRGTWAVSWWRILWQLLEREFGAGRIGFVWLRIGTNGWLL